MEQNQTRVIEEPFRVPPWWFVDLVLVSLVVSLAFGPFPDPELRPDGGLALAAALAPVAVIPLRRRWPFVALGAAVALFAGLAAAGMLLPGVAFAVFVTVFHIAGHTTRRIGILTGAVVVVIVVATSMFSGHAYGFDSHVLPCALMVAFAAAAGDAGRSHRDYVAAVTERAERAEQTRESEARRRVSEERLRIARDLHDTVAHQISVISLNAGVASSALAGRPEKAREALGAIRHASRTVLGEIGDLLRFLRADDGETAPTRPQPGLDRLDELLASFAASGLAVTVRTEGELSALSGTTGLVAYRVVQEGLTNALKHGSEHRAHVLIASDASRASDAMNASGASGSAGTAGIPAATSALTISITNPVPVDADGNHPEPPRGGHGLVGLRERVASVRGTIDVGAAPGGYRLSATLPLSKESAP